MTKKGNSSSDLSLICLINPFFNVLNHNYLIIINIFSYSLTYENKEK